MAKTHLVAKALIFDSAGKFLLLTRSDTHPTLAGYYDLPGGMIEPSEEPGAGVLREIQEETGITTSGAKVLYATTMLIGSVSYPTLLYCIYLGDESPAVTISWEHSSYEWAGLDKLAEVEPQLAPTYREALQYIRANDILSEL